MPDLILALDVLDRLSACNIVQATSDSIDAIKLGYPLVLAEGIGIAKTLSDISGLPLIADFKVADIPNTNRLIAEQVFAAGFSSIICHGFPGADTVMACTDIAHDAGGKCFVVCEMSHPGATTFYHGGVAEHMAKMAMEAGADGIIAPATRPERVQILRDIVQDALIYSPGIGTQGGDASKIVNLVDGMIVGRSIYEAADPKAAAKEYAPFRRQ
jgi:orotidine-5'-phosphate decarboxylase